MLREICVLVLLGPPQIPHGLKVDRGEKKRLGIRAISRPRLVAYFVIYIDCDRLAYVGRILI